MGVETYGERQSEGTGRPPSCDCLRICKCDTRRRDVQLLVLHGRVRHHATPALLAGTFGWLRPGRLPRRRNVGILGALAADV